MSESGGREETRAWRLFLQTHATVLDVLEQELRDRLGLPLSWYEVLLHLSRAPEGRQRMSDLARSVLLSKSGLTRLIDRMEGAGLIERSHCPSDRRGTFASLTPRGKEAFEEAAPLHLEGIRRHFLGPLTPEERDTLADLLARVLEPASESATSAGTVAAAG
ncbi:MAG: MarR family winged helix-turn-helix transcriptional regulator [Actinomycetota bacterium]